MLLALYPTNQLGCKLLPDIPKGVVRLKSDKSNFGGSGLFQNTIQRQQVILDRDIGIVPTTDQQNISGYELRGADSQVNRGGVLWALARPRPSLGRGRGE